MRRARRSIPALALAFSALALTALDSTAALANGAFPDSIELLLPVDRPRQLVLSTNFGLLISNDDGSSWDWMCEPAILPEAVFYLLGAPPDDVLYAMSYRALARSRDACTWPRPEGVFASARPSDIFPDPIDPARLLAIARTGTSGAAVYESRDFGRTFGPPLYQVAGNEALTGVEIARSDPRVLYLTAVKGSPPRPVVIRSEDSAVDHRKVWFRAFVGALDGIATTFDGGETAEIAFTAETGVSAFLERSDGTVLVGHAVRGGGFISTDGGRTFGRWASAVHPRSLAERDGVLYAAGDDILDGFALASSRDGGRSWQTVLRFRDIRGVLPSCQAAIEQCGPMFRALIQLVTGARPSGRDLPPIARGDGSL